MNIWEEKKPEKHNFVSCFPKLIPSPPTPHPHLVLDKNFSIVFKVNGAIRHLCLFSNLGKKAFLFLLSEMLVLGFL